MRALSEFNASSRYRNFADATVSRFANRVENRVKELVLAEFSRNEGERPGKRRPGRVTRAFTARDFNLFYAVERIARYFARM